MANQSNYKIKNLKIIVTKKERGLLVSEEAVEADDELILFVSEVPSLQIRPEIVYPSEPATLPTSHQPWIRKIKTIHSDFRATQEKGRGKEANRSHRER